MRDREKEEQLFEFADKVFHRVEGRPDPIFPPDHHIDWADMPEPYRYYPSQPRLALTVPDLATLDRIDWAKPCRPAIDELALILFLSSAPLRRNLDIDWNSKVPLTGFQMQQYRRGTTAGGGLYPVQHYLVVNKGHGIAAGVYHYATAQHALVPLRAGPWALRLAQAVTASDHEASHDAYLVLAVDYWQNCFKYHNFGYHVCCEDVGAMAATAFLVADALGLGCRHYIAFDDAIANTVIGVDGAKESAFAVIGLGAMTEKDLARCQTLADFAKAGVAVPLQTSRNVRIPPEFERVHRLSHISRSALAPRQHPKRSSGVAMDLTTLVTALTTKQSTWGSMWSDQPIAHDELVHLLRFVSAGNASPDGELADAFAKGEVGICLQALDVGGLAVGAYRWDANASRLDPMDSTPPAAWQQTYHMKNYNMDETACIAFVTANIRKLMARHGVRGFRMLNAYVGMIAQLSYLGAANLRLDCGVALGVCAQRVKAILQLPQTEDVILAIYLSKATEHCRLFDFRLVSNEQVSRR